MLFTEVWFPNFLGIQKFNTAVSITPKTFNLDVGFRLKDTFSREPTKNGATPIYRDLALVVSSLRCWLQSKERLLGFYISSIRHFSFFIVIP